MICSSHLRCRGGAQWANPVAQATGSDFILRIKYQVFSSGHQGGPNIVLQGPLFQAHQASFGPLPAAH